MAHWFNTWAWTYDPRAVNYGLPAYMPFLLFPRQEEMVRWLEARISGKEDGLIEKSRDIGFTWVTGGFALHRWLFTDGFKTTFGSRKAEYVDRLGDPDSIFERIRIMFYRLPAWMRPNGFDASTDDNSMRLLNPSNGNTIRGEAGDDMGRGGRSSLYIVDEAAFIERAERVDAATSANTDVRIWGSTVNGIGNLFARKRHGGELRPDQIFRFHWRDDPRKDDKWAAEKRTTIEEHVWASEYDIDYTASVEGLCIPGRWVEAARRIGKLIRIEPGANGIAGLDVGAGKAKSVFVARFGPVVTKPKAWLDPDTIETAHRGLEAAQDASLRRSDGTEVWVTTLHFDTVGVGKGVAAALARKDLVGVTSVPVNVGEPPSDTRWPDGEFSEEKFLNMKGEIWTFMRECFKATYEMVLHLEGLPGGQAHPVSELIVLPDGDPDSNTLAQQLSLPKRIRNERGKIMIEKKESLARRGIASPDYAEALALTFARPRVHKPALVLA